MLIGKLLLVTTTPLWLTCSWRATSWNNYIEIGVLTGLGNCSPEFHVEADVLHYPLLAAENCTILEYWQKILLLLSCMHLRDRQINRQTDRNLTTKTVSRATKHIIKMTVW